MHRIYFDENEGPGDYPDDDRYALWLRKSLEDIAALPSPLANGDRVQLYWPGLEVEATVVFSERHGHWMAHPDSSTVRHTDVEEIDDQGQPFAQTPNGSLHGMSRASATAG